MLKNFVYSQDGQKCSVDDESRCTDELKFIPLGEWTGAGQYQTTKLNLIPVQRSSSVAVDAKTTQLEQEGPVVQTSKDISDPIKIEEEEPVVAGNAPACSDNTAALVVLIMFSVLPLFVIGVFSLKIKNLSVEVSHFEMTNFNSAQSKKVQDTYG